MPVILRRAASAIVSVCVLALVLAAPPVLVLQRPAGADTASESALLALVNGSRSAAGLAPLTWHAALSDAARSHSASMAATNTIRDPNPAVVAAPLVPGWTRLGANVGTGSSAEQVHAALMASGVHRANILGDYNLVGIGTVLSGGRVWVTQLFALVPTVAVAPAPAPEPVVTVAATAEPVPAPLPEPEPVVAAAPAPAPVRAPASRVTVTYVVTRSGGSTAAAPARTPQPAPAASSPQPAACTIGSPPAHGHPHDPARRACD